MTIQSTDHTPGVKRLHVLRGAHDTAVVVSQYPSITAAAKREVIAVASRSGLAGPINLIATCPIQSPQTLSELGLEALHLLIAVSELTAAQRLRKAAERVIACWEYGNTYTAPRPAAHPCSTGAWDMGSAARCKCLADAVRNLTTVLADQPAHDTEAVMFDPLPEGRPTGGFLEIVDCPSGQDTYPWEADVELLLGSDGQVYALVDNNADALPTLDENGYALKSEPRGAP